MSCGATPKAFNPLAGADAGSNSAAVERLLSQCLGALVMISTYTGKMERRQDSQEVTGVPITNAVNTKISVVTS